MDALLRLLHINTNVYNHHYYHECPQNTWAPGKNPFIKMIGIVNQTVRNASIAARKLSAFDKGRADVCQVGMGNI